MTHSRIRAAIAPLVVWLALAAPEAARACSVCTAGRDDDTRAAFLGTTLFLSVLPLAMVGGMLFWVRRRLRQRAEGQREPLGIGVPSPHS